MKTSAALLVIFAAFGGCTQQVPDRPVLVAEVIENIHAWDGKVATVNGWLGTCQGYDCGLYSTLADAKIVAMDSSNKEEWSAAMDRRISIGFDQRFDKTAFPLQFKQVTIRAKISDECRGWMVGCTDRTPDLHPISIRLYSPEKDK